MVMGYKRLTARSRYLLETLTVPPASQEIPLILRNLTVHYRIHNSPLFVPTLSRINSVQITAYFCTVVLISP
jgi:hypothetical protein